MIPGQVRLILQCVILREAVFQAERRISGETGLVIAGDPSPRWESAGRGMTAIKLVSQYMIANAEN
jgi:hypothetical protein